MKRFVAIALAVGSGLLWGCGGSGNNSVSLDLFPDGIYVLQSNVNDITTMSNMSGAGWQRFDNIGDGASIAFGSDGGMYVAESDSNRIVRYSDALSLTSTPFGSVGSGVNQFNNPTGIAFDSLGRIYIADSGNGRIVRINDITGAGWTTLDVTGTLTHATRTYDVALDSSDRIYVVSRSDRKLARWDNMADNTAEPFGSAGSGVNQFEFPNDIHIGENGKIHVSDSGNDRIVRFDDMTGTGWVTFGSTGSGVNQFNVTNAISTDSSNRIYVFDVNNSRVVRINDMTGAGWIAFGSAGTGVGQFVTSSDLVVKD